MRAEYPGPVGLARRACVLLAALLLAAPAAWAEGCRLSRLEIPVRIVNQRPIGTLQLNGREVPMLVDSGGFFSMLSASAATELGLKLYPLPGYLRIEGYTGSVDARMTKVEKVGLNGSELHGVEFIVGGNEMGSGIMGVLGRNFLSIGDTEYDLAHGVVRLMFPKGDCDKVNFAYWAGDAPVIETDLDNSNREGNDEVRVRVRVNDVKMRAVMDTGAAATGLTLRAAYRAGLKDADLTETGRIGGVGERRVRSWTARIASFEFGGEKVSNNRFQVDDTENFTDDMLIGLDYFLAHRIYVSRLQRKVYATWNGGPVFARGAAVGNYDARYAALPAEVAPDDASALLRRGEASAARGELDRALADLNRACELAPQAETNFLARARVHLAMEQLAKARADLDEALRLHPALDLALALRARLRADQGERDAALADLRALDATLPPSSPLRADMAVIFVQLDQPTEALQQWALWVPSHRHDAGLARALNGRCWLRTRLGVDLELAVDDCKQAVKQDDGEPRYRDSLGWAYLRQGEMALAVKTFDEAIKARPLSYSFYGRALAQRGLGHGDAAQRDLAEARRLSPQIDQELRRAGLPLADDAPAGGVSAVR